MQIQSKTLIQNILYIEKTNNPTIVLRPTQIDQYIYIFSFTLSILQFI